MVMDIPQGGNQIREAVEEDCGQHQNEVHEE